jgi:hypothetical protein
MKTFRNNSNRRFRFRNNDRNYKRNGDGKQFNSDLPSPSNFQRKTPGRNNHNAPTLIEKYNDLAREALSNGDKILSENYFQHADHFMRILGEQENNKSSKVSDNKIQNKISVLADNNKDQNIKS